MLANFFIGKESKWCGEMAIYVTEVIIQCASIRDGAPIRINTISGMPDVHANRYTKRSQFE